MLVQYFIAQRLYPIVKMYIHMYIKYLTMKVNHISLSLKYLKPICLNFPTRMMQIVCVGTFRFAC